MSNWLLCLVIVISAWLSHAKKRGEKYSDQVVPVLQLAKAPIRHDILAVTLNTVNYH